MKKLIAIGFIASAGLLGSQSQAATYDAAQYNGKLPVYTSAEAAAKDSAEEIKGSWYFGGAYGRGISNIFSGSFAGRPPVSRYSHGGKALLGYQFNRNLAAEFSYTQFGKTRIAGMGNIRPYAFALSGVGIVPFNKYFTLGASVGVAHLHYRTDASIVFAGTGNPAPCKGVALSYGVFGLITLVPHAYLRVGFDQVVRKTSANAIKPNPKLISVGLVISLAGMDGEKESMGMY